MKTRRWLVAVACVVGLVLTIGIAVGVYALPELVRRVVIARVHAMTGRPVAIDRVDVSLLTGRVVVHGFRVAERGGESRFADFARLDLRIKLLSLLVGHVWIRDMVLEAPTVRVVRVGPDEFNFSDLLGGAKESERGHSDLTVDRFLLKNGTVVLEDRTLPTPRTWTSEQIAIEAHDVSTRRSDGRAVGSSLTAGAPVSVTVQDLRLYPIHLQATVAVQGLDLTLAQVYLPPDKLLIDRGRATASVRLALDARQGLQVDATSQVHDVVVLSPDGETLARVPQLTARVNDFAVHDGGFRLGHLAADGALSVRDPTVRQAARLQHADVRAKIANFTWPATAPGQIDVHATMDRGGKLAVTGAIQAPPAASELRLRVANLDLAPWAQLLPIEGRVSGVAEADLRMNEPLAAGIPARLQGSLAVNRVAVADARQQVAAARRIEASGLQLELPAKVVVGRVVVTGPRGVVERDRTGAFPAVALFGRRSSSTAATGTAPPPPTDTTSTTELAAEVREVVIRDGAVSWRDATVSPPVRLDISAVEGAVTGVGWPLRGLAGVRVALQPPGGGHVQVNGRVTLEPVAADLRVRAQGAQLAPYQPYLPTPARLSGAADLDLAVNVPSVDEPRGTARGTVGLSRVDVRDSERTVMRIDRAQATGVDVAWPERVAVSRLALTQPWLLVERDEKGQLSLRALQQAPASKTAPATPAGAPAASTDDATPLAISIAQLSVDRGGIRIVDQAVTPAFAVDLQPATVRAQGLSTEPGSQGRFDVTGQLGPGARLQVRGTLGPLRGPLRLDLTGDVREFAVPRANPYVLEQAGWRTTDGRLTSSVQVRIDGDALSAKTNIRVSRLQLVRAAREDGAKARIGLPLGMLTSLLKDRHGDIVVSFPVGGRLSDPRFDFSETVWSAVRTVAVNAVTLPVSWIGRVRFTADSRIERIDVDPIPFEPGTAEPTPAGRERLTRVAAFLDQLPAVQMAVTPVISPADADALRRPPPAGAGPRPGTDDPSAAPAEAPTGQGQIRDLARRRLEAVRATLEQAGVDPARLQARSPVERDGGSRVALDVLEPEAERPSKIREAVERVRERFTATSAKE